MRLFTVAQALPHIDAKKYEITTNEVLLSIYLDNLEIDVLEGFLNLFHNLKLPYMINMADPSINHGMGYNAYSNDFTHQRIITNSSIYYWFKDQYNFYNQYQLESML